MINDLRPPPLPLNYLKALFWNKLTLDNNKILIKEMCNIYFSDFKKSIFNQEQCFFQKPVIIEMNGSQSFPYYWYVFYSFHNTTDNSKLDMIQSKIQVQFESQNVIFWKSNKFQKYFFLLNRIYRGVCIWSQKNKILMKSIFLNGT